MSATKGPHIPGTHVPIFAQQDHVTELLHSLDHNFSRVVEALTQVQQAVIEAREWEQWTRKKNMVRLDGTGAGTIQLTVPLGYSWILTRCTITSTQNGQCQFFIDTTSPQDLAEVIGNSLLYSDSFANNIFVPGGSTLFVVFTGAGANGQGTVNLQMRVIHQHDSHLHHRARMGDGT